MAVKAYVLVDGEKVPLPGGEGEPSVPVLPFVVPNETASTATLTATVASITKLYDGLTIAIRIPFNNVASSTLNINGLGAKPIYYQANTTSGGRIVANAVVLLVYETVTVSTGCWKISYAYQADNTARQYQTTTNKEYPVICRYNNTDKGTSYENTYLRYALTVTLNPSTLAMTVPGGIKGSDGNELYPRYAYGTGDLTAGTSALATGSLYFVYE